MNDLAFIASVVGSLAIPVTVVTALVVFRKPLTGLIGRVSTYEGLGQKVQFGEDLAGAEKSVSEAVVHAPEEVKKVTEAEDDAALRQITSKQEPLIDFDVRRLKRVQLGEIASANPSYAIIKSWEELSDTIIGLAELAFPGMRLGGLTSALIYLADKKVVSAYFAKAASELLELRDRVAHGEHDPTAGQAITYVQSVLQLIELARIFEGPYKRTEREAMERSRETAHKRAVREQSGDSR